MRKYIIMCVMFSMVLTACSESNIKYLPDVMNHVSCNYIANVSDMQLPDDSLLEELYRVYGIECVRTDVTDRIIYVLSLYSDSGNFIDEKSFYGFYKTIIEWSPEVITGGKVKSLTVVPSSGVVSVLLDNEVIVSCPLLWVDVTERRTGVVEKQFSNSVQDVEQLILPNNFNWRLACSSEVDTYLGVQEEAFLERCVFVYAGYIGKSATLSDERLDLFTQSITVWLSRNKSYGVSGYTVDIDDSSYDITVKFLSGTAVVINAKSDGIYIATATSI